LSCIDCSKAICSNCLVECPVGFRCKACVGSVKNPLKGSDKKEFYKTFGLSVGIGCGGGWAMQYISIPYISCIICFFLGMIAGRWLATKIDFALLPNAGKTITCGLLLGLFLTPLAMLPSLLLSLFGMMFATGGTGIFTVLTVMVSALFCPACYIAGVLQPTVGRRC
jgi:hypothetical protein